MLPVFFGCVLLATVFNAGCGKEQGPVAVVAETEDPQYQSGEQMLREGHPDQALAAFLSVIKVRADDAPESHLEAGRIYLNNKNDPIAAIYHFRAYLAAKPTSDQAPMVRELINTGEKDFARSLPGAPNIYDEADLVDQIKGLQSENANLRHELGSGPIGHLTGMDQDKTPSSTGSVLSTVPANNNPSGPINTPRPSTPVPVAVTAAPTPAPAPAPTTAAKGRTYTVQEHDTLSSISLKIYGTKNRWQEIYNLNRDQLSKPEDLHIGQVLKLPAQ